MKITREELEVVAKECGFDLTFRLEKFARLAIEAVEAEKAAQVMASPAGLLALT
jgi:hypothetical protein